jgi:hypothetical protein
LLSTDKQAQNLNLSLQLFSLKQIIELFAVEKKQLKCKWCFFMSRIYSLKPWIDLPRILCIKWLCSQFLCIFLGGFYGPNFKENFALELTLKWEIKGLNLKPFYFFPQKMFFLTNGIKIQVVEWLHF